MKIGFLCIVVLLCLLTACGQGEAYPDLKNYVNQLQKNYAFSGKEGNSKTIYKLVPIEYQKAATRSPFDEGNSSQEKSTTNPLSGYPVNVLRFVGTISENTKLWAYIVTPDNKVYKITEGDKIGDHDGTVRKISSKQIEILEQSNEDEKQDAQRIVTLQLKEEG